MLTGAGGELVAQEVTVPEPVEVGQLAAPTARGPAAWTKIYLRQVAIMDACCALAGGLLAFTAPASAYVVCNRSGDCWHTEARTRYPGVGYTYHPDDWYFHQTWSGSDRHYRDYHEGRGYYKGGVWVTL